MFYDERGILRQVPLNQAHTLPEGYSLDPAQLVSWPDRATVEHDFVGHLVTPNLKWLPGADISTVRRYGSSSRNRSS